MNVPVTLVRIGSPALAADAFLLPDADAARLGEVFAGLRSVPQLFRVRGGFVLVPSASVAAAPPGLLRLRRVAAHFYVPIDAELSPAILPDEFPGLTRGRGLVMLPAESLAFDPTTPVPPSHWLALPPQRTATWRTLPELPPGADVLRMIERPAPPELAMEILRGGEPDGRDPLTGDPSHDTEEDARPPSGSLVRRTAAGAAFGVGRAMAWLGKSLGMGGLARAGANLARRAVEMVPRLSEKVLGAQEAALRKLLQDLQSGDAEKALRRAPIASPDPASPAGRYSGGTSLSDHDTRYSFADLFRRSGGAASVWAGSDDIWTQLQAQYRRLAEEAVRRGDYRRAAYLWGVLLRDIRAAANVLKAGGLYRDAAVLYRDKLGDPLGAAETFELAGDYDEAVRLYEKCGEDLKAAELLRRIGDEERAEHFFLRAAGKLADRGEHLNAGDLVRTKVGRAELANDHYRTGWRGGQWQAVACGERLLDDALVREDAAGFDELLDDGARRFAPPATAEAGHFFNYALEVGPVFLSKDRLADLRDRVRLLYADHLRAGDCKKRVDTLFGDRRAEWSPTVRRDAGYAAGRQPVEKVAPRARSVVTGKVRAVANALDTGLLFIGTNDTVTAWDARTGATRVVARLPQGLLRALCVDRTGHHLYALIERAPNPRLIAYSVPPAGGESVKSLAIAEIKCEDRKSLYLQPRCFDDSRANFIVVSADQERNGYHAQMLVPGWPGPFERMAFSTTWHGDVRGMLYEWSDDLLEVYSHDDAKRGDKSWTRAWDCPMGWQPVTGSLDWATRDENTLVLAGVDADGVVHRTEVRVDGLAKGTARHSSATHPRKYRAVAVLRANLVAAATTDGSIVILRNIDKQLLHGDPAITPAPASPVVFLGHFAAGKELVAVLEDGSVVKVPDPTAP